MRADQTTLPSTERSPLRSMGDQAFSTAMDFVAMFLDVTCTNAGSDVLALLGYRPISAKGCVFAPFGGKEPGSLALALQTRSEASPY